jgi:hypothetical protein
LGCRATAKKKLTVVDRGILIIWLGRIFQAKISELAAELGALNYSVLPREEYEVL